MLHILCHVEIEPPPSWFTGTWCYHNEREWTVADVGVAKAQTVVESDPAAFQKLVRFIETVLNAQQSIEDVALTEIFAPYLLTPPP